MKKVKIWKVQFCVIGGRKTPDAKYFDSKEKAMKFYNEHNGKANYGIDPPVYMGMFCEENAKELLGTINRNDL